MLIRRLGYEYVNREANQLSSKKLMGFKNLQEKRAIQQTSQGVHNGAEQGLD
jgi:hypothetical protein